MYSDTYLDPADRDNSSSVTLSEALELSQRYQFDDQHVHLQLSITTFFALLNISSSELDVATRCCILGALGSALTNLYKRAGSVDSIDKAITVLREAISLTEDADVRNRVPLLVLLTEALCVSFETRAGATAVLDEAIQLARNAIQLSLELDGAVYGASLHAISRALLCSYIYVTASEVQLDECLQFCRQGLQYCGDHCNHLPRALLILGTALSLKYRLSRAQETLYEAGNVLHYTLTLHPTGCANRSAILSVLSTVSLHHYVATGDISYIEQGVAVAEEALSICLPENPFQGKLLGNLAMCINERWRQSRDGADLEKSIQYARTNLSLSPSGHPNRWFALNNLAAALYYASWIRDKNTILREVMELHKEALSIYQPGHRSHTLSLLNFSISLHEYYWMTGDLKILEDAIANFRECLHVNFDRGAAAVRLADILTQRFTRLGTIEDLEEAIHLYKDFLVQVDSWGSLPDQCLSLAGLGGCLLKRFDLYGRREDLDNALEYLDKSSHMATPGRNSWLVSPILGDAYSARFGISRDDRDAVLARQAYDISLEDPNTRLSALCFLRRAYLDLLQDKSSISARMDDIHSAVVDSNGAFAERLGACLPILQHLGNLGMEFFVTNPNVTLRILDIYSAINQVLLQSTQLNMTIGSRLQNLRLHDIVAGHVLSYGRACDSLSSALEIFEESRSLFWAQALHLRASMEDLPQDLREKIIAMAQEIESSRFSASVSSSGQLSARINSQVDAAPPRQLADTLHHTIQQARLLPGLDRFMLPDNIELLMNAAERGSIIILTSGPLSCDAIVLAHHDQVVVSLPYVNDSWLVELNDIWDTAIVSARKEDSDRLDLRVVRRRRRHDPYERQRHVLGEMWRKIVLPIITRLGLKKEEQRPRVWWCCSGSYASLPIHAAGAGSEWFSDYAVSSYIPNIGALSSARRNLVPIRRDEVQVLLGAMEEQGLNMTKSEIRDICAIIPPFARLALPAHEDATHPDFDGGVTTDTLMQQIPNAHILHLACHGTQDSKDPLSSGFILKNEKLTIAKLMRVPLPRAFFAFMSACETAKGDTKFANQNIHLGGAMLFAGFKSVIGTMWSMDDVDGPIVTKTVYERLFEGDSEYLNPETIPYALDEAIQKLRARGISPGRWATYIHLGI